MEMGLNSYDHTILFQEKNSKEEYNLDKPINYERLNLNLNKYPRLSEIYGEITKINGLYSSPYKQDKKIEPEYNFYGILNSTNINFINLLGKLNNLCEKLEKVYYKEQIKNGLNNNVFSFLSELEFANYFQTNGIEILEIEPLLKSGKKLDLKIKIGNKQILVEVITPREKLSMVQKDYAYWAPISLELENNILAEFNNHKIEEPFIIAIDGDYAGIDEINLKTTIEEFLKMNKSKANYLKGIILKRKDKYFHTEIT